MTDNQLEMLFWSIFVLLGLLTVAGLFGGVFGWAVSIAAAMTMMWMWQHRDERHERDW